MPIARSIDIDCYAILEIVQSADAETIKRAYRRLSLLRHPDKNPGNPSAHDAFCTLNTAFDVLSDPNRRILYDAGYSSIKIKREAEAREHARQARDTAEAERLEREQEQWQTMERRRTEELLREQKDIKRIEDEILKVLKELQQVKKTTQILNAARSTPQGWWSYITDWRSTEAREADKRKNELDILQSLASERIKLASLTRDKDRLDQQRKAQKEVMLMTEKQFQLKREKIQKYRREHLEREAAAKRKAEQERLAKEEEEQKRQQEAQARWRENFDKEERERTRAREAAAKEARENLEKARQKAAQERLVREEQEKKRQQESLESAWEKYLNRAGECAPAREAAEKAAKPRTSKKPSNGMPKKSDSSKQRNVICTHPGFWPKVSGQNRCEFCSKTFYQFVLRCPECGCMACANCRNDLKGRSRQSTK